MTGQCLTNFVKKDILYPNKEVIVVDNGSEDGSAELFQKLKKKELIDKLILNKENLGYSAAINQAFKAGTGKYYFLLNNDINSISKKGLDALVKLMEKDKTLAAVQMFVHINKRKKHLFYRQSKEIDVKRNTLCGVAMLIRAEVVNEVGGFDQKNFSPAYGEETDWCYRVKAAGYGLIETKRARVGHYGSITAKKRYSLDEQYLLMNTHRFKAMLFNLSIKQFLLHAPGLIWLFLKSFEQKRTHLLLKACWSNLKNLKLVLNERKKRKAKLF